MDLEIQDRREMPHLDREEVTASISYDGVTPSRKDVQKEIASSAGADEGLVVVRQIKPVFGGTSARVTARIYENEDSLKSIEGTYMVDRHAAGEEVGEAASEEAAEPAEETEAGEEESQDSEEETSEEQEPEEDESAEEDNPEETDEGSEDEEPEEEEDKE